jgi:hypothetical protein
MPKMNGFELSTKILELDVNPRICYMSSGQINQEALREQYPTLSIGCFIKKPVTIDLGYADYSEYFIGHAGSTYYRKTDKEKVEIFRKIEPYLTFLDFAALERKGADTQTKIEELEATNQMLRQKDSMNTDAIAGLSDQLTKVMHEIEVLKKLR